MMRDILNDQYKEICWDTESGITPEALEQEVFELEKRFESRSKSFIKAKTFELLLEKGQIAVLREDIFQEKVNARNIMIRQRSRWWNEARPTIVQPNTATLIGAKNIILLHTVIPTTRKAPFDL